MKKLLLSFGLMSLAASLSAGNFVPTTPLIEAPTSETKVIIEGWTMAQKGFMTQSPGGASVFAVLDKSDANRAIFTEDYVYTLIPVEGSTTDFYILGPDGLYAPKGTADMNTDGGMTQAGVADVASAGTYKIGASTAITTAAYADKYMFVNTNQSAGKSHMEVHFKQDGSEFKWCYLETGTQGMQDAGNTSRTAAAFKVYVAEEQAADPVEVTLNYPSFGGFTPAPVTVQLFPGEVSVSAIPAVEYFTATGVDGVVGTEPTTLNITGDWTFPFALDQVYRLDIRKKATKVVVNAENGQAATNNQAGAQFAPTSLFYVKGHGFNADNRLAVTLHNLNYADDKGFGVAASNNAVGNFAGDPTQWIVKVSNQGADGVALQHIENSQTHLNDISGGTILGVWQYSASQNDNGSFIRFHSLTESDFETTTWEHNGRTYTFDADLMNAVRSNASSANVRALFDVEEPMMVLTFKRNADDATPLVQELPLLPSITALPSYDAFTRVDGSFVANDHAEATYVLNEGTPFRLYNERTGKYVHVTDNGLYQTANTDVASIDFIRIPAGENGAFVIYNPSTDKFVGSITGTQSATSVVDFCPEPVKYYTGKQESPRYMDWIGNRANSEGGYNFFNDFQGNYVCGYSWNDAGSKWIIITDNENFETNWELRNRLVASRTAYALALERLGQEDVDNLADFAANYDFDGDVNLPVSEEYQAKIATIYAKVQEAQDAWPSIVMNSDKLYTIQSADSRGALIYDTENDRLYTTGPNGSADATDENHLWGFVKSGEKYYLYNYGARKFASAYKTRVGGSGTAAYVWTLSEIPTAVTLTTEAFGAGVAFTDNKFTIEGGKTYNSNPAGFMIINDNPDRVPCSLGEGAITDGTPFTLAEVETPAIGEEMTAKAAEGLAKVNDEIDMISAIEWEAEIHGLLVGHYTAEAVETFASSLESAKALADKEAAMYAALEAKVVLNAAESLRQVVNGHVYTISDSDGNAHYTDGTSHLIGEYNGNDAAYLNWIAAVDEDGNVSFYHNHDAGEEIQRAGLYYEAAAIPFALDGVSSFKVTSADRLGSVSLVNAADQSAVGDKTYAISFVSADANDGTTKIEEITVGIGRNGNVYDLQGRKLAAPVKGINIIGGKKVLVK